MAQVALELVEYFETTGSHVFSLELSPDEQLLAVADSSTLCVHEASSGEERWSANIQSYQAAFSPDGKLLAVANFNESCVQTFSSETGAWLSNLSGHTSNVSGVAWSSTGIIASASNDKTARLWSPENNKCLQTLEGHAGSVFAVAFSPDGTKLASGGNDNTIRIWQVASGNCLHTLTGHTGFVWRVAFSPDGSKLASPSRDGTVRIWDSSFDFSCIRILAGGGGGKWPTVAWSPDSGILASANETTLQLWDKEGASILQAQNHASMAIFSCYSHKIITGSRDGKVSRWISPIAWSLFFDVNNETPFGKLHPPSKSPHDVYGTLECISTIIDRMDPPVAFQKSISRLHELNNTIFNDTKKKTKIASEIEQDFRDLINQRQSLRELHESLQIKAHQHASVHDVNQDISSVDSLVRSISEAILIINKHLQEYATIKPSSATPSLKQYEHSSPKEISVKELGDMIAFSHISNAKLSRLEQIVVDAGENFSRALLEYDNYAGEIREQSEKNLDALDAGLAHLTRTSIASGRIEEIEGNLRELQCSLDRESKIMNELDHSLSAWAAAKNNMNRMLQIMEGENIESASAALDSKDHPRVSEMSKIIQVTSRLDLCGNHQLEQAKSNLKSTAGIAHNPHLVYKWLNEHPDAKLEAKEIFDIMGIR